MICQGTICQETCGFVEQSDDVCGREDDILTRTWFSWPGKLCKRRGDAERRGISLLPICCQSASLKINGSSLVMSDEDFASPVGPLMLQRTSLR